jgi:hypothetical protein
VRKPFNVPAVNLIHIPGRQHIHREIQILTQRNTLGTVALRVSAMLLSATCDQHAKTGRKNPLIERIVELLAGFVDLLMPNGFQ